MAYTILASLDLIHWEASEANLILVAKTAISAIQDEIKYVEATSIEAMPTHFYRLAVTNLQTPSPCGGLTNLSPTTINVMGVSNALTFAARAISPSGCIIRIDYFVNGVLIGQTIDSSSFTWTPLGTGNYSITARAVDNFGLTTISSPMSVAVLRPPSINSIGFASQKNFHNSGALSVSVSATDPNGTPDTFQLLLGGSAVTSQQGYVPLVWQPSVNNSGLLDLAVRVADQWGIASTRSQNIYLFRTPPTP